MPLGSTNIARGVTSSPATMATSFNSSSENFSSSTLCCFPIGGRSGPNLARYERNGSRLVSDSAKSSLVSCRLRTSASSDSFDASTACGAEAGAAEARRDPSRHRRTRPSRRSAPPINSAASFATARGDRGAARFLLQRSGRRLLLELERRRHEVRLEQHRRRQRRRDRLGVRLKVQVLDVDDALELADVFEEVVDLVVRADERHADRDLHVHLDGRRRLADRRDLGQARQLDLRLHALDELLDVVALRQHAQQLLLLLEQRVHLVAEREVLDLALLVLLLFLVELLALRDQLLLLVDHVGVEEVVVAAAEQRDDGDQHAQLDPEGDGGE